MSTQVLPELGKQIHFSQLGERILPASAVARRIGKTPRMVRYLIARNQLLAIRRGKLLFCVESEVERYRKERRHV